MIKTKFCSGWPPDRLTVCVWSCSYTTVTITKVHGREALLWRTEAARQLFANSCVFTLSRGEDERFTWLHCSYTGSSVCPRSVSRVLIIYTHLDVARLLSLSYWFCAIKWNLNLCCTVLNWVFGVYLKHLFWHNEFLLEKLSPSI